MPNLSDKLQCGENASLEAQAPHTRIYVSLRIVPIMSMFLTSVRTRRMANVSKLKAFLVKLLKLDLLVLDSMPNQSRYCLLQ